jgi:hypothetical protein
VTAIRSAAILAWITAVGFGLPAILAISHLLRGLDIPFVMGFPAYGRGPFERIGIPSTVPLLSAFLVACVLEGIAGWLLWNGDKAGGLLAMVIVPVGALFWWGFALPFPPLFALVRSLLILAAWRHLH